MTRDEGFSIISVNSDDEDEIVIQAGLAPSKTPSEEPPDDDSFVFSVNEENDFVPSDETNESKHASGISEQPKKNDAYRPTTREDLDEIGPFPKTRLAIIMIALLIMVGFVVYYALTH